jgi:type IV pilus assembly protein PilC
MPSPPEPEAGAARHRLVAWEAMTETTDGDAISRVRTFWRRALLGPSPRARMQIYEELAPALAAGIGVREALRATAGRHRGAKRRAAEALADGVDRDVALSQTMRANPELFTPLEAALVTTGERTGRLDAAFRAAAAQLERAQSVRNRMIQAVSYPLLLVHCFILMCSFVRWCGGGSFLLLAVPSFAALWGGIFLAASFHASRADDVHYARFLRRVPVVGSVVRKAALARFARAFASVYGGGALYGDALTVAAEASGDAAIRADAADAAAALETGSTLPDALGRMPSIPADDLGLLVAGEHAGALEDAATRVSILEDALFDVAVNRMALILRNGFVIVMGIAVGLYAISFYRGLYAPLLNMK